MSALSKILSSKVRAEIFRILFGLNAVEIHMREIERRTGFAIGTIQSELKKLLALDLVVKRRDGNRLYYRANTDHPLYPDIRSIVLKTVGLVEILRDALEHDGRITVAFAFGSMAADRGNARSDVGLVVIGDAVPRDVPAMLSEAADKIGREINPIVLTEAEFAKRLKSQDHFVGRHRRALEFARKNDWKSAEQVIESGESFTGSGLAHWSFSPEQMRALFAARGLSVLHVAAISPFLSFPPDPDQAAALEDDDNFAVARRLFSRYAESPEMVGISIRLLIVGRKPA